jgi:hypothetical protein
MKISAITILMAAAVNPVAALQGGYLDSVGSSTAPAKGNWGPSKGAYKVPAAGNSYFDNIAADSSATPLPESAAVASAPVTPSLTVSSLSEIAAAADANPVPAGAYLSSLKVMSVAGNGEGPIGYLGTLKVESVDAAANNPAGYLDTLRVESAAAGEGGPFTYVGTLKGAKTVVNKVASTTESTVESNAPILAAIQKLNDNMVKNQQTTIGVLQEINSNVKTLVSRAESQASESQYVEETELTSALVGSGNPSSVWSGQAWRP